jgi:phosphatidate cytidylyltransferase
MRRLLTAAVLIPLFWVLVKWAPPWAFYAVSAVAIARAAWECYGLLEGAGSRPHKLVGLAACLAVLASFIRIGPAFPAIAVVLVVAVVALTASLWRRDDPSAVLRDSMATLFPVVFIGVALSYAVKLRAFPGELGEDLVLLLVVCAAGADTGAYYVGSAIGRHPLAPRVSPKKTWEGVAGGVLGSVVGALVAHLWFFTALSLTAALVAALLIAAAAVLGDLAESVVKRAAGAKDASNLLPGHGGLLDRADSLLFSGPVLYYYYLLVLASGPGPAGM